MKISEILSKDGCSVSFEVFPPKRDAPTEPVLEAVKKISEEKPSFISVTYGAGGGANTNTIALAEHVQKTCGVPALAHLTCLTSSREKIASEIQALRKAGIENVLCLRGDSPDGSESIVARDFTYAADLVRSLRPSNFCLGGACYPECHPDCAHLAQDIENLKLKVDAGLDFLTTQMFFDNNVYFRYLAHLRNAGITIPVIAGIMPVTNGKQIARICKLSGTVLPPRFRAIVDRFGDNPNSMLAAGIAYATEQIIDLFADGVKAVHVYTMNKPEVAKRIMANLQGLIDG
jgi:methylenetetrahydrofolate reductase (NADPH)